MFNSGDFVFREESEADMKLHAIGNLSKEVVHADYKNLMNIHRQYHRSNYLSTPKNKQK